MDSELKRLGQLLAQIQDREAARQKRVRAWILASVAVMILIELAR